MMELRPILSTLRRHKVTAALVIAEIALTCAIVCNAVFLVSQRLQRMHLPSGVDESALVEVRFATLGAAREDNGPRIQGDVHLLSHLAGVQSVTATRQIPFGNSSSNSSVKLSPEQKLPSANVTRYTGEGLMRTLGLKLLAGRPLQPADYVDYSAIEKSRALPGVTVITQALAQRLWPGQNALGKTIYLGDGPLTVVGVVEHLVRPSITDDAIADDSMVLPIREDRSGAPIYLIRADPGQRARVLRQAAAALKAAYPHRILMESRTLEEVRRRFFRDDRAMAGLLSGVCVALLVVTALGIVGLASFWVAQRRHTIGVRRALGARRSDILRYFQAENFLLASIGIGLGMVLAYGLNLLLMLFYELPRLPSFYFPVGAVVLWLLGQLAVLGPARRAAAVPPVVATRSV